MKLSVISQFLLILRLLAYSAIISAFIKYIVPQLSILQGLSVDTMNISASVAVTIPVAVFAVVLCLKR